MCQKMRGIVVLAAFAAVLVPGVAQAQMIGVGPRFSLVRGDLATSTPTSRFFGGTVRVKLASTLSLEGAADYKTSWNRDRTLRLRETPIQGSILLYPIRGALAPYVIGGMGIYARQYDTIADGKVTASTLERKPGAHLGFGGDLRLSSRIVAYLDYRYRFVKFGNDGGSTQGSSVPGLGQLGVSHQGSMWTGGVAFVF